MRISTVANINFKANYIKVRKYGQSESVFIMTDNSENLGRCPVCETKLGSPSMTYDGKYYTTNYPVYSTGYKIKYKDTGKYENGGKQKSFDYQKLLNIVDNEEISSNRTLIKGNAKGKIVSAKNLDEKTLKSDVPLILICDNEEECYKYFKNVDGMIIKFDLKEILSHFAAFCRAYFTFCSYIADKNLLNELEKLEGKFVSISNMSGDIVYKQTAPFTKRPSREEKIYIPQIRRIDKLLTLDECEKDTVGNKAYNLKRMMNLAKQGKLTDVVIPNAFVLPQGYLERVENCITENPNNLRAQNVGIIQEIKNFAKDIITKNEVIVRSAFNGEDLDGYSAAGLYASKLACMQKFTLEPIFEVIKSKNTPVAIKTRVRHGIPDENIKPSIIIQNYIMPEYSFTTYTQSPDDKDKMLIELFINEYRQCKPDPYQIIYDRKTKKLSVKKQHSVMVEYIFDENSKLINKKIIENKCFDKIQPILKKLVKNALVLEKEFGMPQDIEGGIKDNQLYFWQSRNIVQKK